MTLSAKDRKILSTPYDTFSKLQTFQVGNKKLTVQRQRTTPPQKIVRGIDRIKEIQKSIPNVSSKRKKSCLDCFFCYEDRTITSQNITGKAVSYRCQRGHGTPYIDPERDATSPEKWLPEGLRSCPDFVSRDRFNRR